MSGHCGWFMRLLCEAQTCRGDGVCRLPPDAGRSNAFDIRLVR